MAKDKWNDIPAACPVTGERLYVSELTSEESGVQIRGRFKVPPMAQLDAENTKILELFLRSKGVISTMEKELGLSYPTVRARVDAMIDALGLEPIVPEKRATLKPEQKQRILKLLEEGRITAQEAKERMKRNGVK